MKIKKGDNIIIRIGKDKGKKGKVTRAFPATNKVIIEGLNLSKKHIRPRRQGEKGSIIEIAMPLQASNVALVEGGKAVRVGYKMVDGKKVRISRQSQKEI